MSHSGENEHRDWWGGRVASIREGLGGGQADSRLEREQSRGRNKFVADTLGSGGQTLQVFFFGEGAEGWLDTALAWRDQTGTEHTGGA